MRGQCRDSKKYLATPLKMVGDLSKGCMKEEIGVSQRKSSFINLNGLLLSFCAILCKNNNKKKKKEKHKCNGKCFHLPKV